MGIPCRAEHVFRNQQVFASAPFAQREHRGVLQDQDDVVRQVPGNARLDQPGLQVPGLGIGNNTQVDEVPGARICVVKLNAQSA